MSQGGSRGGSAADSANAVIGPDITPIRQGDAERRRKIFDQAPRDAEVWHRQSLYYNGAYILI
jgi:hypothetical protein